MALPTMTIEVTTPSGEVHSFPTRLQAGSKFENFHLGMLCLAITTGEPIGGYRARVLLDGIPAGAK